MQTSETEQKIASRDRVRRPVRTCLAALANAVAVLRRVPAVVAACAFLLLAGMQTSVAAPVINSLNPASGSTAGDTYVTINGADFGTQQGDVISVTFGGVAGQSPELLTIVEAGTQIGVRTPAHPAGTVDVVVTVAGGVATKTAAFTFVDPPVLSGVAPAFGSPAGGATLTIQGSNLATAFSVELGTCAVDALFGPQCDPSTTAAIVSQTDTEIVVTAPALAEGTYDLLVSTDYGKTILADAYTATSATAVSNVTISANPLIAGQATTIQATFTSTTALAAGDTITVKLAGYTFPAGATTVIAGAGFVAGTSVSGTVAPGATDTVVVSVGAGGTDAGSFATLGIPAINPAAGTLVRSGLTVATSKDTRPTASNADIVIAAAPITGVAFIPSSFTAGADISLRVDFTDPLALATGDTITLGYTGFVVPTSGLVAARNTGFLAGTTFAVDATTAGTIRLTVTGSAPAGSANSLTLSGTGLKNPATASTIAKAGLTVRTTATPISAAAGADVVITAPPPRLAFLTLPAGCIRNAPCPTQPRVAVQDAEGNQIDSSASITLTKTSGPGALSCASNPVAATAGVATFSGCTFDQAGDYLLTASASGATSADSTAIPVTPSAVSNVTISANPLTAGEAALVQVQFTSTTALVAGDTITVKLTGYSFPVGATTVTAGAGFAVGTSLSGTVAAGATDTVVVSVNSGSNTAGSFATLAIAGVNPAAGTLSASGLTVATSKDPVPAASSADIVITPVPITGVAFTPSSFTAGADISLRVDFTDPLALAIGDTITIRYTGFVVPPTGLVAVQSTGFSTGTTFAVNSATTGTISVTVTGSATAGSARSLTVGGSGLKNPATAGTIAKAGLTISTTATTTAAAAGADVVIVAPPPRLAFITQPAGCIKNTPCTTQPRVAVQDSGGNQIDSSASISLAKKSGPGALSCASNPVSAVAGVATFSGCTLDLAGDYVLTASASGATSADSAAFTVRETPILSLEPGSRTQLLEDDKCCTSSNFWDLVDARQYPPDLSFRVTPPPGVSAFQIDVAFESSSPSGVVSTVVNAPPSFSGEREFYVLTAPNAFGQATLRFSATINDQEVETLDVPITVAPVNDAPTATFKDAKTHFVLAEGQTELIVPGFVTSTSPGPADEAGQSVSLSTGVGIVIREEAACAPPPSISMDGTVTFPSIPSDNSLFFPGCSYSLIVQDDGDNEVACSLFDGGIGNSNRGCRAYEFSYTFPSPPQISFRVTAEPFVFNFGSLAILSTVKTSPTPDLSLGFDVTHRGNFRVQGIRVQMPPPSGVASATWTCLTPQGSACTPESGSGAIDVLLDLDVAETAEFRLSGTYRGASFFTFQPVLTLPSDLPPDTVIVETEAPTRFIIPASSAAVFLGDFEGN